MSRRILIIKTSSIGDILQAFSVLPILKEEGFLVDWVVDTKHKTLCLQNPLIDRTIVSDINSWIKLKRSSFSFDHFKQDIQRYEYQKIFDLQGNWKSSFLLYFAKGEKVGYGKNAVKEKINLLFTDIKVDISRSLNIRTFYKNPFLDLFEKQESSTENLVFLLSKEEKKNLSLIEKNLTFIQQKKVFVSVNSNWENKRLGLKFVVAFLNKIEDIEECHFFFSWGNEQEKEEATLLSNEFANSTLLEKCSFPLWQHILEKMDLLIATDSSFLSLCSLTNTPSFSFFGPTRGSVFAPLGRHGYFQGSCPYKISFCKQCPQLRTCKTGSCIKDLDIEDCFLKYRNWSETILEANQN